jgi:hypothetical protein
MGLPSSAVTSNPPSAQCPDLRTSMAIMQEVESPDYLNGQTPVQLVDLYDYIEGPLLATGVLNATHIFWTPLNSTTYASQSVIASMLSSHPILYTRCPANYPSCTTQ